MNLISNISLKYWHSKEKDDLKNKQSIQPHFYTVDINAIVNNYRSKKLVRKDVSSIGGPHWKKLIKKI